MKKLILSAALSALTFFGLGGCTGAAILDAPTCGGTTDKTDYNAPKTIESKELTSFYAHFYLNGEWSPGKRNRFYTFEVKPDESGTLIAVAQTDTTLDAVIRHPADEKLLAALQSIIDKRKLAAKNGVYRVTAGLPPEFQECHFSAAYASGEKLTFTMNNNPAAEWTKDMYIAFVYWLAENGDSSLLPPQLSGKVERVTIEFTEGDLMYDYGDWYMEDKDSGEKKHVLIRNVYDKAAKATVFKDVIPFPESIHDDIFEILGHYDLRPFDSESVLYGRGRKLIPDKKERGKPHLLSLQIKYDGGHILDIDTSDKDDIETLRPLLDELFACHDSFFEE